MQGLDILTFIIMAVLVVMIGFLIVKLGALPGNIAQERNHPQSDAIRVCGWIGILTLGIGWPVALIWAYTRPKLHARQLSGMDLSELVKLKNRMTELEKQVSDLTKTKGGENL